MDRPAVSLLARLRAPGSSPTEPGALRRSILEHLRAMCSTRLGSMPVRPDYGLPAISEMVHSFPDAATAVARALQHTIDKYEPRLTDVRVRHVPSEGHDLTIRFEVTAKLRDAGAVRFETRIDASRRVQVE